MGGEWGREEHSVLEGGKGKCLCFGVERRGGSIVCWRGRGDSSRRDRVFV